MADEAKHDYWNSRNTVPCEHLHELLTYDPQTGEIRSRIGRGGRTKAGKLSGDFGERGYLRINIRGKYFYGHRIAWCMKTGEWPDRFIDHIDGDKSNNAWSNLRLATKSQNGANMGKRYRRGRATSHFKGVSWSAGSGSWRAQLTKDKKSYCIGNYRTELEAHEAYIRAAEKMHGDFARG